MSLRILTTLLRHHSGFPAESWNPFESEARYLPISYLIKFSSVECGTYQTFGEHWCSQKTYKEFGVVLIIVH